MASALLNPEFGNPWPLSSLTGKPVIEACAMGEDDFFSERADQSEVKARIVSRYFPVWASIIAKQSMHSDRKLAYIDLFAGPGRYEDGSASTPLMVLAEALKNPDLKEGLVSIFNDEDEQHTSTLETEIEKLPDIAGLKHKPRIYKGAIDESVAKYFDETKLIPTFFFIDPFGYKGLSSALIHAVIKDWASECVFFFNYSRINAGVSNPLVLHHMQALFGDQNLAALQERLESPSVNREKLILEHLTVAMIEAGAKFVLPFRFRNNKGTRTTHHIVFVTKHQLGYEKMKEIMAKESSYYDQGVPSLEYSPALEGVGKLFESALDELEDDLAVAFKGQTISMVDIYHQHNPGKPYIKNNYKVALDNLERSGRVKCNRPKRRANTFADDILVTFPRTPIARE